MWYLIAALIFSFVETVYFGWNVWSSCEAEVICDVIVLILIVVGAIKVVGNKIKERK